MTTDNQPALQPPDRLWIRDPCKPTKKQGWVALLCVDDERERLPCDIEYTRAVDGGVAIVDEAQLQEYVLGFCPERGRGNAVLSVEGELTLLGVHLVRGLIARFFQSPAPPAFVPDPRHWQPVDNDAATAPIVASVERDNERDDDDDV